MSEKLVFERMMTPAEVAECFLVDPKTVSRWARAGLLPATRTPGGHHRFRESDVKRFMEDGFAETEEAEAAAAAEGGGGDARA